MEFKGYIVFKFIKCGKEYCHCMKGGSVHGPYPHLQWWDKGKIKTKYLNKSVYQETVEKIEQSKKVNEMLKELKELQKREKRFLRKVEKGE